MKKGSLKKTVEGLSSGDVVCVEWCDASTGKSSSYAGVIDVPVKSWGVFVGLLGNRTKHIVLAQNSFQYADGLYDLDYTAIPLSWAVNVVVVERGHFPPQVATGLVNSFLMKDRKVFSQSNRHRTFQRRLSTHGRPD
ncbi:MAG: hypothetical protein NWE94_04725 [Candidatus Bathyarchaeota archaeon]|nr:hypothetical protein [Candidatus Bathyarchaeota archaeon]